VAKKDRKALGRDPFEDAKEKRQSGSVKRLITARPTHHAEPREVDVRVKLTPANLKHLENLRDEVARRTRHVTRDELIRIAIALLTAEDVA